MSKDKSTETRGGMARSAGTIGAATLLSRLLGFARDVVIARLFGVYLYSQAFVIAFKIPNLFRDIVGEGAANAAFVPVFSEYVARKRTEEFWELVNAGMNLLLVVLSAITLLGILFSPLLVRLVAPGFAAGSQQFLITVRLNRFIFPYILLVGLAAYFTGVLNSLRHFSVPAFAPCLLNIAIIVCALVWGEGVRGLASGILLGGLLQLAVQLPVLHAKGFRFRFSLGNFHHPDLRRILKLMTPRLFSTAIYQLNNFVDTIFGSLAFIVGQGGVAALYFSYRLIQFPLGIFSNSLSQAILPQLSCQALEQDRAEFKKTLAWSLRSVLFVMIPATAVFMVMSRPMVSALFRGGKFDSYAVDTTASALFYYSVGLFAYGATKVINCAFFALKDTVTPTKNSALALCLNIVFNAALMFPMGLGGIALATSLSGIISFWVLLARLDRAVGGMDWSGIKGFSVKVCCASLVMAAACYFISSREVFVVGGIASRIWRLCLPLAAGTVVYALTCVLLRVETMLALLRWLKRR